KSMLNPNKSQAPNLPSHYLFRRGKEEYKPELLSNYPTYHTAAGEVPANDIPRYWGDMSWTRRTKKEDIDSRIRTRKLMPYGIGIRGIFTWPLHIFMGMLEKIDEEARKELGLEERAQNELLELRMRYEAEEISKREFKIKEKALLRKLEAIEGVEKKEKTKPKTKKKLVK
ncbi:gas vesicle protein GvpG, partial [Patescibacteria group bacterium AH-259-L05]|nr:gas vesicle protein GvpG [Patescibacteria group bacterium AH-259-L05]